MLKTIFFLCGVILLVSGCTSQPGVQAEIPAAVLDGTLATPTQTPPAVSEVTVTENPDPVATPVPENSRADMCENPYFPVADTAAWNYGISTGEKSLQTITVSGENTFTLTIQGNGDTFTIDGQCTEGGIVLMDVPGVSSTYSGDDGGSSLVTDEVEGVTLPNDVQVGDDWSQVISITGSSGSEYTLSAKIESSYKAIGFETVDVPAGSFYALKVEQNSITTMGGQSFNSQSFIWYAQGVGSVKAETEGVYTSVLESYSLP